MNSIDKKFEKIGFIKAREERDKEGIKYVRYERYEKEHNYIHIIDFMRKPSGYHIVQSFDRCDRGDGFADMVGLTMYELKLCLKKMKSLGWKIKK